MDDDVSTFDECLDSLTTTRWNLSENPKELFALSVRDTDTVTPENWFTLSATCNSYPIRIGTENTIAGKFNVRSKMADRNLGTIECCHVCNSEKIAGIRFQVLLVCVSQIRLCTRRIFQKVQMKRFTSNITTAKGQKSFMPFRLLHD